MRKLIAVLFSAMLLGLGACTRQLQLTPAPGTEVVSGPGEGAVARLAGVRIEARVNAWNARPDQLAERVTPMLVTIDNQSNRPLLIRYENFKLVEPDGTQLAAMPPFNVRGSVTEPLNTPPYLYSGFYVAPYLSPWYPSMPAFSGPFYLDPFYYDQYYPSFVRVSLPTADMIQLALPEGVLNPQGRMTGFLYFEHPTQEVSRLTFTAHLIDAQTRESFGTLRIPFLTGYNGGNIGYTRR